MRHRQSHLPHGLCKEVYTEGRPYIGQFKDGLEHGLLFGWDAFFNISIYEHGTSKATVSFTEDWYVAYQKGNHADIAELTQIGISLKK